jgi:hypothetical protein
MVSKVIVAGATILTIAILQQPSAIPRNALRTEALGCYELLDSAGRNASLSMEGVAPLIRLDSALDPMQPNSATRRLDTFGFGVPSRFDPVYRDLHPRWTADSLSDTLRLTFTNGFVGAVFSVNLPANMRPDTLSGRAWSFQDIVGADRNRGPAWAIRRPCPK